MIKITEILSKEVLSVADAASIGIIANAYMSADLSRLRGWTIVRDDTDDEGMLPPARILGRADVVTVMNTAAVKAPFGIRCPLGMKTYDSEGRLLGVLRDLSADERTGRIYTLHVDDKTYEPSSILRAGPHGVILRAPTHGALRVKRAPVSTPTRRPRKTVSPTEETAPEAKAEVPTPALHGAYAFLVGRTVSKDIRADGELLASEGSTVDAAIIEKARAKGKLVELTVNSKKA